MNDELERRYCAQHNLTFSRRAEDGPLTFAGYAAVFNSLSVEIYGFREKIAPGAFAASLGDDVRALWDHQTGLVMGRTKSNTLRLAEDATGLHFENEPPLSAAHQIESVQRGDVDQMSFGFRTLEDTWDIDEVGTIIRTLLKVKLYEVSYVTFPAYPATSAQQRSDGRRVDAAYGLVPTIPQEFRRAPDSHNSNPYAAAAARARLMQMHRQLRVLELE